MIHEVRLLSNARRDRDNALAWFAEHEYFDHIDPFLDDFYATLRRVSELPHLPREVEQGLRHVSMARYNFHIWYRTYSDTQFIDIIAILHQRSDPQRLVEHLQ